MLLINQFIEWINNQDSKSLTLVVFLAIPILSFTYYSFFTQNENSSLTNTNSFTDVKLNSVLISNKNLYLHNRPNINYKYDQSYVNYLIGKKNNFSVYKFNTAFNLEHLEYDLFLSHMHHMSIFIPIVAIYTYSSLSHVFFDNYNKNPYKHMRHSWFKTNYNFLHSSFFPYFKNFIFHSFPYHNSNNHWWHYSIRNTNIIKKINRTSLLNTKVLIFNFYDFLISNQYTFIRTVDEYKPLTYLEKMIYRDPLFFYWDNFIDPLAIPLKLETEFSTHPESFKNSNFEENQIVENQIVENQIVENQIVENHIELPRRKPPYLRRCYSLNDVRPVPNIYKFPNLDEIINRDALINKDDLLYRKNLLYRNDLINEKELIKRGIAINYIESNRFNEILRRTELIMFNEYIKSNEHINKYNHLTSKELLNVIELFSIKDLFNNEDLLNNKDLLYINDLIENKDLFNEDFYIEEKYPYPEKYPGTSVNGQISLNPEWNTRLHNERNRELSDFGLDKCGVDYKLTTYGILISIHDSFYFLQNDLLYRHKSNPNGSKPLSYAQLWKICDIVDSINQHSGVIWRDNIAFYNEVTNKNLYLHDWDYVLSNLKKEADEIMLLESINKYNDLLEGNNPLLKMKKAYEYHEDLLIKRPYIWKDYNSLITFDNINKLRKDHSYYIELLDFNKLSHHDYQVLRSYLNPNQQVILDSEFQKGLKNRTEHKKRPVSKDCIFRHKEKANSFILHRPPFISKYKTWWPYLPTLWKIETTVVSGDILERERLSESKILDREEKLAKLKNISRNLCSRQVNSTPVWNYESISNSENRFIPPSWDKPTEFVDIPPLYNVESSSIKCVKHLYVPEYHFTWFVNHLNFESLSEDDINNYGKILNSHNLDIYLEVLNKIKLNSWHNP